MGEAVCPSEGFVKYVVRNVTNLAIALFMDYNKLTEFLHLLKYRVPNKKQAFRPLVDEKKFSKSFSKIRIWFLIWKPCLLVGISLQTVTSPAVLARRYPNITIVWYCFLHPTKIMLSRIIFGWSGSRQHNGARTKHKQNPICSYLSPPKKWDLRGSSKLVLRVGLGPSC